MRIGFIGLGAIGTQMAKRLIAAGHDLSAFGRGSGVAEVAAAGGRIVNDYAALASSSELLIVAVFTDAQVRSVLCEAGTLMAMRPGTTLALHTTGSPRLAIELQNAAPGGTTVLDATFSGGPQDVAAGRLLMMVGGASEVLERARPAFESYAREIHHVGPLGSGQSLKLLNNLLFATNAMNAANILQRAEEAGFETATAARIFQQASGGSFAMGRFTSAAPLGETLDRLRPFLGKDVAAAIAAAEDAGIDVSPFLATARYFVNGMRS